MRDADKTKEQLIAELHAARQRANELEELNRDRIAAERALSEAEQLYRNILDNAVAGFFQTTPDGRYLVVNEAMARIFGYRSPLEMTESIQDARRQLYVDSHDRDDFEHLIDELGSIKEFEYRAYRKDGSIVWVSDNARAVRDREGSILYYEGNTIDISERREAAAELERTVKERTAALQESNDILVLEVVKHHRSLQELSAARAQLKAILDTIPGIVSCVSADLRYLGVNQHLAHAFNTKPEEFVGQDIGFLGASIEFSEFVRDFFSSNDPAACSEINTLVQEGLRSYLVVAQKYAQNQAAFTVGIDITERRQTESELRTAKNQLQAILDAVPGIVSWIDCDLRYLGVNRHLARNFNMPPEAFVGQDIGFLGAGAEFNDFTRSFFSSPIQEAYQEVTAKVSGTERTYLIVAQKYDDGKAAFFVGIDISERKHAEAGLKEAETKYRSIFENAIEGIFQATPNGRFLSANPALARILGYDSPEELLADMTNIGLQMHVNPEQRAEFLRQLQQSEAVVGFEMQVYCKDGSITWISENARAIRDETGQLLYYEGTIEDISDRKRVEAALQRANEHLELRVEERTAALKEANHQLIREIAERRRAEQALRASEAELKALFAAMTDIITVFDAEGRYVKVVATSSEVLYAPTDDRIGKSVYEVLPPKQAELFATHIQRVLNLGQTIALEYSLPVEATNHSDSRAGDREIWFSASVSPMPNNCVIWVARNITERKRVQDALKQAEAKYRSIFENAAEGIFQATPAGQFLSANPALVAMYGYRSEAELLNQPRLRAQLYETPSRYDDLIAALDEYGAVSHFESQIRRQDGRIIWVSENVRAVRDDRDRLLYYEGTIDDISQRKRAEAALRAEQEKSERLLLNILPQAIAEQLKEYQGAIAERFESATVLFADIVNFTPFSASVSPLELVQMLNQIFSEFDQLAEQYGLEKIKTIGDAYMVAGGLPRAKVDHAAAIANMALAMQAAIAKFQRNDGRSFEIRIGIHTGSVVAGVIGTKKFIYDLWGDTVNIASRMEMQGEPGRIQMTAATRDRLPERFQFEERGTIDVKGCGPMTTYWLVGQHPE